MSSLYALAGDLFLNRPTRNRKLSEMMVALQASGQTIARRLDKRRDTTGNRKVLSHIVGIERWGQRRLRVVLGEPFLQEEYDAYRPPITASWDDLRKAFAETRQETVRLIGSIERAGGLDKTVMHNEFGPLTTRGWLRYLDLHANLESHKIR